MWLRAEAPEEEGYPALHRPLEVKGVTPAPDRPLEEYMNLDYAEAERVAQAMVAQAYKHHGEVTLLFHNENLLLDDPHIYHTRLYRALLQQIIKLSPVVEIPQL